MLTREQRLGTQFEILVAELLRELGYHKVKQNLVYSNGSKKCQVDVQYTKYLGTQLVVCECKYISSGNLMLSNSSVDNIVEKLEHTRKTAKADKAELYTNRYFSEGIKRWARKYSIKLYDRDKLTQMHREAKSFDGFGLVVPFYKNLDHYIHRIKLKNYDMKPTRM